VSAATVMAAGWGLLVGIAGGGRDRRWRRATASAGLLGLSHRLATLVACGNSICGNSAIAAVAPVIGADGEEVAASITFTAVLGVAVVLAMPPLAVALNLGMIQAGIVAGLDG
jgi:uncharacterized membrane protein YadS